MDINSFISRQHWIFAKTYAERAPHEYCLKDRVVGTEQDFVDAVNYIWEHGFTASFWYHPNTYLYLDGHLYWVMEKEAEKVTLINRSDVKDYDIVIFKKKNVKEGQQV